MARFATGRKSRAICDRCGFEIRYLDLRAEWNGLRVCPECWEPKHPQLEPRTVVDAQALFQPRPGENKREDVRVVLKTGVAGHGKVLGGDVPEYVVAPTPAGVAATGRVWFVVLGIKGAGQVGAVGAGAGVEGVNGTGAIGTPTPTAFAEPTGVNGTGEIGAVSISIDHTFWGSETWGAGAWGE